MRRALYHGLTPGLNAPFSTRFHFLDQMQLWFNRNEKPEPTSSQAFDNGCSWRFPTRPRSSRALPGAEAQDKGPRVRPAVRAQRSAEWRARWPARAAGRRSASAGSAGRACLAKLQPCFFLLGRHITQVSTLWVECQPKNQAHGICGDGHAREVGFGRSTGRSLSRNGVVGNRSSLVVSVYPFLVTTALATN